MDCFHCQVKRPLKRKEKYTPDKKCCQFSPFWSAFAIGAWLEKGEELEKFPRIEEMELTLMGALHPRSHRISKETLCHFYDQNGGCGIWSHRPSTCFTFFCASELGSEIYTQIESWQMRLEANLLKLWFEFKGGSLEDWNLWCGYMDERPKGELPSFFKISQLHEAKSTYRQAHHFLKKDARAQRLLLANQPQAENLSGQYTQLMLAKGHYEYRR